MRKTQQLILRLYMLFYLWPVRNIKFLSVKDYVDLLQVAKWEIEKLSFFGDVYMISAPIFSGGSGSVDENIKVIKRYYQKTLQEGYVIWNQIPYLDIKIKRWTKIRVNTSSKIKEFYVPIINKNLNGLVCIKTDHEYKDSLGCRTERIAAEAVGINLIEKYHPHIHKHKVKKYA
ncbi:MAG: hypothetical protein QY321_00615 [Patescibacteria group bacterium]|nr:MAG: hypothetical protein QY321_00615 [Patescibacteria group bacterium]